MAEMQDDLAKRLEEIKKEANELHFSAARDLALALREDVCKTKDAASYLFEIASQLETAGYLSDAESFFLQSLELTGGLSPKNYLLRVSCLYRLGTVASAAVCHDMTERLDRELFRIVPEYDGALIYLLYHMSYLPGKSPRKQRSLAEFWARHVTPAHSLRPKAEPLGNRPLKVGYVSPDFAFHPVGLFLRDILPAHDPKRVEVIAYSCRESDENPIAQALAEKVSFKNVFGLSDAAFDQCIRDDHIDCLVDLAGFTSKNRLTVFAREPAPCLVSWLGYWATTGLRQMDAVLLDPWHAPTGTESDFTEPIYRLPITRFCYQPLPGCPPVSPTPPCVHCGHITFGSFNNTMKLNAPLLDVWAGILSAVPHSHLLLKWKTFHDPLLVERIKKAFERRGIARERIECRGWSPVGEMLNEFADVDIALDPFPFSGGMTSCNALWMGVPLVTLAGKSVAGRQGYAFMQLLDLEELTASCEEQYHNIAVGLAKNVPLLMLLRVSLRDRMRATRLLDTKGLANDLEDAFLSIYERRSKDAKRSSS